jgi:hypothetical protein
MVVWKRHTSLASATASRDSFPLRGSNAAYSAIGLFGADQPGNGELVARLDTASSSGPTARARLCPPRSSRMLLGCSTWRQLGTSLLLLRTTSRSTTQVGNRPVTFSSAPGQASWGCESRVHDRVTGMLAPRQRWTYD